MLGAIAVELATSPWADDLLVTLVGCLAELPETVATGGSGTSSGSNSSSPIWRDAHLTSNACSSPPASTDLAAARGTGVADDAWAPEIVLLADDIPSQLRERLERVLHQVPHVGLAAVTWARRSVNGAYASATPAWLASIPSGSLFARSVSSARSMSTSSTCCGPLTPTRCPGRRGLQPSRPVSRPWPR